MKAGLKQSSTDSAILAEQGAEAHVRNPHNLMWAEVLMWLEWMLSALVTASRVTTKCLLRECRAVRTSCSLAISETVSMQKPPTGEPSAGKPPARFGGRGG